MKTNDRLITDLMKDIKVGKIQLPDFQRGWVWDDNRIRSLIASITNKFPVGAAMFLDYGNPEVLLKYRMIEGAPPATARPEELILDGQQRLTSIFSAMYSMQAVKTRTDKGKEVERFYYIDIEKSLDPSCDRIDAIISVPKEKIITADFGRKILLDLSTQEKEFENKMFPLNIIFDNAAQLLWQMNYLKHYNNNSDIMAEYLEFQNKIVGEVIKYQIPVIALEKETPKEAVCQVFENVNTGGISLTVFELLTAIFATDNFNLREDWEERRKKYFSGDILKVITAKDFITACTLLKSYKFNQTVSCKKKDVLNLKFAEYKSCADILSKGFKIAEHFIEEERIFYSRDLPYTTQLIPLAVICTLLKETGNIRISGDRNKLKKWYWCGVFGELYGGMTESRYVNDVVEVMNWICKNGSEPRTVSESNFNPMRLTTLLTRNSAAYKGVMALILKNDPKDFISGQKMDLFYYKSSNVDIHHIFPQAYCKQNNYDSSKWNSVINKTPICYDTNRKIGGVAPSVYIKKIMSANLKDYLETHLLEASYLYNDDFDNFIVSRAKNLLDAIEKATGKKILGRDSAEVIKFFGQAV